MSFDAAGLPGDTYYVTSNGRDSRCQWWRVAMVTGSLHSAGVAPVAPGYGGGYPQQLYQGTGAAPVQTDVFHASGVKRHF